MPLVRIPIEDTSDCETCERRHKAQLEMLTEVKCKVLRNVTCRECGRTFSLLVAEDRPPV